MPKRNCRLGFIMSSFFKNYIKCPESNFGHVFRACQKRPRGYDLYKIVPMFD